MKKLWAGRTDGLTNQIADDFNSSISFDSRMAKNFDALKIDTDSSKIAKLLLDKPVH